MYVKVIFKSANDYRSFVVRYVHTPCLSMLLASKDFLSSLMSVMKQSGLDDSYYLFSIMDYDSDYLCNDTINFVFNF